MLAAALFIAAFAFCLAQYAQAKQEADFASSDSENAS